MTFGMSATNLPLLLLVSLAIVGATACQADPGYSMFIETAPA